MTDGALVKVSPQEAQIVALMLNEGLNPSRVAVALDMSLEAVLEVLKRESVRRALGVAMLTEKRERAKELKDDVLQALWHMACHDVADLVDPETGAMHTDLRKIPKQLRLAIKGVKQGKYGLEYTFVSKDAIMLALANILSKVSDGEQKDEPTTLVIYDVPGEEVPPT